MTRVAYKRPTGYAFDGDPKLIMTPDGTTMEFNGGQPVMDAGLENAALISLFTDSEWWGNQYLDGEFRIDDGAFNEIMSGAITRTTFVQAENEIKRALKWMVDDGLASEIEATVTNRAGTGIDLEVNILAPSGTRATLALRRYGANWIRQADDPATARLNNVY